ncbi:unnamed protein product [Ilex paraguariensis]|uniref:Uncharacterized protein n=1 Tax=Ilex paraguariensis TaxID=185542 RepID=A0ABC8SYU2_9AQUA
MPNNEPFLEIFSSIFAPTVVPHSGLVVQLGLKFGLKWHNQVCIFMFLVHGAKMVIRCLVQSGGGGQWSSELVEVHSSVEEVVASE